MLRMQEMIGPHSTKHLTWRPIEQDAFPVFDPQPLHNRGGEAPGLECSPGGVEGSWP